MVAITPFIIKGQKHFKLSFATLRIEQTFDKIILVADTSSRQ